MARVRAATRKGYNSRHGIEGLKVGKADRSGNNAAAREGKRRGRGSKERQGEVGGMKAKRGERGVQVACLFFLEGMFIERTQ